MSRFRISQIARVENDIDSAWNYLEHAHRFKLSATLQESEMVPGPRAAATTESMIQRSIWPSSLGIDSSVPIFIVGVPRYSVIQVVLEALTVSLPHVFVKR